MMNVYFAGDGYTHLTPRPWGDCACSNCWNWMLQDLQNCVEKSNEHLDLKIICNSLSRWTVWIPWDGAPLSQYGLNYPVVIDTDNEKYLSRNYIINWWHPSLNKLYPIRVIGDGNCLPHAVSMAIWGIQDLNMTLRHLLYINLLGPDSKSFCERWKREREFQNSLIPDGGLQYTEEEWNKEWSIIVSSAEDQRRDFNCDQPSLPYESLEELHIFVLANILRRPIIVLAQPEIKSFMDGSAIAHNNFVGIYLPLLWPAEVCYKFPIVLGFLFNHFEPLVSKLSHIVNDKRWSRGNGVPLITADLEMLHIHFTLTEEESKIHEVVQNYLNVFEVSFLTKEGITEQLLVALLPSEELMLRSKFCVPERPLSQDKVKSLVIDKDLVYDRVENPPPSEECSSNKYLLAWDIQRYLTVLTNMPILIATKKIKPREVRKFKLEILKIIENVKRPVPRRTVMTLEELREEIFKGKSESESELTSGRKLMKTSRPTCYHHCHHCHRCHCHHCGAQTGFKNSASNPAAVRNWADLNEFNDEYGKKPTFIDRPADQNIDRLTDKPTQTDKRFHVDERSHAKADTLAEYETVERPCIINNISHEKTLLPVRHRNGSDSLHDANQTSSHIIKCKNDGCDRQRMEGSMHCRICDFQQKVTAHAIEFIESNVQHPDHVSFLQNNTSSEMVNHTRETFLQPMLNMNVRSSGFREHSGHTVESSDTVSPIIHYYNSLINIINITVSPSASCTKDSLNKELYAPIKIKSRENTDLVKNSSDADKNSSSSVDLLLEDERNSFNNDEYLADNKSTDPNFSELNSMVLNGFMETDNKIQEKIKSDNTNIFKWVPSLQDLDEPDLYSS